VYLPVHFTVYTSSLYDSVRERPVSIIHVPHFTLNFFVCTHNIAILLLSCARVYDVIGNVIQENLFRTTAVVFEGLTYIIIDYCHPTFSISLNRCDDGARNPTCVLSRPKRVALWYISCGKI